MVVLFRARGIPHYSDVYDMSPWFIKYEQAEEYGQNLLEIGNWDGFTIEKWTWREDFDPGTRRLVQDHTHTQAGVAS